MALHPSLDHSVPQPAPVGRAPVAAKDRRQLDALTSLRFLAAALIVIGHAHPLFGSLGIAVSAPLNQGVSFFFVLSGFILAYNYRAFDRAKDVERFFVARFARVWPLHVFTCLLWMGVVGHFDAATIFPKSQPAAKLVSNLLLVESWVPLKSWIIPFNGVAWSISLEFFFYLVFPFLIRTWNRAWHLWLGAESLLVLCFLFFLNRSGLPLDDGAAVMDVSTWTYFSPFVRILEFMVGVGVARWMQDRPGPRMSRMQWLLLEGAVIAIAVVAMTAASADGIGAVFGPVVAYYVRANGLWPFWALVIATFAVSDGPIARLLSRRPFVFLGEISFALYLLHVMVLLRLEPYRELIAARGAYAAVMLWAGLLSLSALVFIGIERPVRQFILNVWARRHADRLSADRFPFRLKELGAVVALAMIAIVVTVRPPSTIVPIDETEARAFLDRATVKIEGSYPNGLRVLGLQIEHGKEGLLGSVMLHADRTMRLDSIMAIHLNDASGTIVAQPGDFVLDAASATVDGGVYWIKTFALAQADIDRAATLGVVMYPESTNLLTVTGTPTDWGGKRLLFPLH